MAHFLISFLSPSLRGFGVFVMAQQMGDERSLGLEALLRALALTSLHVALETINRTRAIAVASAI
jgi:hypothetical protein